MATQSELRWISQNPTIFGVGNIPADGVVANYVRNWYLAPEQHGEHLDETDSAIFAEFGWPDPVTGAVVYSSLPIYSMASAPPVVTPTPAPVYVAPIPSPVVSPPAAVAGPTAAAYAATRPDLLFNWARATNPGWRAAYPDQSEVVTWILGFGNLMAYLLQDFQGSHPGATFSPGTAPSVPPDITSAVAGEVPTTTPATNNPSPTPNNPTVPASLARPVIQVGVTHAGNPIMQLVDDAGTVKQWIVDTSHEPGYRDMINVGVYGVLVHTAQTDEATALPAVDADGNPLLPTQTEKSSTTVVLLALAAGAAYLWQQRKSA